MHLDRLRSDTDAHLVGVDLGHGSKHRVRELITAHCRTVEQATRRLDLDIHVGHFPAQALEVTDLLAEG